MLNIKLPSPQVILHLTDLHFGYEDNPTSQNKRDIVLRKLVETIKAADAHWQPTIVCVSGDITHKGNPQGYVDAEKWIRHLADELMVPIENFTFCPGNHDAERDAYASLVMPPDAKEADRVLTVRASLPAAPHWISVFHNYNRFCESLSIPPYDFAASKSHLVGSRHINGILFVCLNSAWFCMERNSKVFIGAPHLDQLEKDNIICENFSERDSLVVSLIHHPDKSAAYAESDPSGGRRPPYSRIFKCSNILLTGHIHGGISTPPILEHSAHHFAGGATYEDETYHNNFRLIRIYPQYFMSLAYEADSTKADYWILGKTDYGVWDVGQAMQAFIEQQERARPQTTSQTRSMKTEPISAFANPSDGLTSTESASTSVDLENQTNKDQKPVDIQAITIERQDSTDTLKSDYSTTLISNTDSVTDIYAGLQTHLLLKELPQACSQAERLLATFAHPLSREQGGYLPLIIETFQRASLSDIAPGTAHWKSKLDSAVERLVNAV